MYVDENKNIFIDYRREEKKTFDEDFYADLQQIFTAQDKKETLTHEKKFFYANKWTSWRRRSVSNLFRKIYPPDIDKRFIETPADIRKRSL